MSIIITVISILALTAIIWWLVRIRILPEWFCPVCAGVLLTWLWMLVVHLVGKPVDSLMLAVLMGGSVVGASYQLEKRIHAQRLLWKMLFVVSGFVAVYSILQIKIWWFVVAVAIMLLVTVIFWLRQERVINQKAEEIKKQMEDCC